MISDMRRRSRLIMFIVALSFVVGFLLLSLGGIAETIRQLTVREPTGPRTPDELGRVGDKSITRQEYENLKNYFRWLYKENTNARNIPSKVEEQIAAQTWAYLVNEKAMEKVYRQERIDLLFDEVLEILKMAPPREVVEDTAFYTEGKFDPKKYERVLYTQLFLQRHFPVYRDYIRQARLDADLKGIFRVPQSQVQYELKKEQTRFTITYLEIVPHNFVKNPDEQEIWAYYRRNRSAFAKPERRRLRYVVFPLTIGQEDSAAARAQIDDIYASLHTPEDFDYLTDREGDSLGLWFRIDSLDSVVRSAVRVAPLDSPLPPLLTKEGWQIIKVAERNKDSVRLRTITVPIELTAGTYSALSEQIGNLTERSREEPFDSVAKELGLTVREAPALELGKPYEFESDIAANIELFAKRAKVGDVSPVFRTGRGELYVFTVSAIQRGLATVMDSFEVRNKVSSRLMMEKARPLMEAKAKSVLRDIRAGKSLEEIARVDSQVKLQTRNMTTIAGFSYLGPEFAGAVYALKPGQTSGLIRTERGLYIVRCDARDETVNPNPYWAQSKLNNALQRVRDAIQKPPRVVDWRNPFSY